MTLIDKAEAHDDDLIRRGDALRVADEVFDQCENVHGDDRGAFAAAEVGARIAALAPTDAPNLKRIGTGLYETQPTPDPAAIREAANLILQDFDAILTIAGKVTEAANSGRSSTHGVRLGLNALIPKGANHE